MSYTELNKKIGMEVKGILGGGVVVVGLGMNSLLSVFDMYARRSLLLGAVLKSNS